jgi:glycosyltransferase involved in cell wall biosynthesis
MEQSSRNGGPSRASRVRVLRAIARLNVGGPALHVTYLSRGLADRGYDTTLVAGEIASGEESMAFVAERAGVDVVPVAGLSREVSPLRDLLAAVRLARLIRALRPQIVHTHTAKAGAVGRTAAVLAGRPRPLVVHTFHGHVLRGYFGSVGSRVFRLLETTLARVTDVLVAVSPQVRDELVRLGVAPAEKFTVVRLGIELEPRVRCADDPAEIRARLGISPERFVVGWFGRMTAVKRTEDLLAALSQVRARGVDALLLLVGDGVDRPRLEENAFRLGLARHCLFLGYQEDVAPWYAACDAVALTSANEGTPVTIIEALAAGRPVVVTSVGGVPDVVADGVDGYLVEPGDTSALADRLERLALDPALREQLGARGRVRALARYSVGRLVDDVDLLYRSLLDERAATSPDSSER